MATVVVLESIQTQQQKRRQAADGCYVALTGTESLYLTTLIKQTLLTDA
jgi:hypothetical protein